MDGAVQMPYLRESIRYSIAFNLISHIVVTMSAAIKQRYNSDEATVNELIAKHRKDAPK